MVEKKTVTSWAGADDVFVFFKRFIFIERDRSNGEKQRGSSTSVCTLLIVFVLWEGKKKSQKIRGYEMIKYNMKG